MSLYAAVDLKFGVSRRKAVKQTMVIIQYTWIHIPEFHDLPRIGRSFVEVF